MHHSDNDFFQTCFDFYLAESIDVNEIKLEPPINNIIFAEELFNAKRIKNSVDKEYDLDSPEITNRLHRLAYSLDW